jgi:hypothetical protein
MMTSRRCFARRVKSRSGIVGRRQIIDPAAAGYCAWGLFSTFFVGGRPKLLCIDASHNNAANKKRR